MRHNNKLSMVETPIPSALSVAPLVPLTIGEVKPKASVVETVAVAVQDNPAVVIAKRKANNRAKAVNLASRGRLPADVAASRNLDDDMLLSELTKQARAAVQSMTDLAASVKDCCDADLDRDDVIEAIVAGGWSENRARTIVSEIYRQAGKVVRKSGAGTTYKPLALAIANDAIGRCGDMAGALKMVTSAANYLRKQVKADKVSASRAAAKLGNGGKAPVKE